MDVSGNGRHAVGQGSPLPVESCTAGNGASAVICSISGTTTSQLVFPTDSIPTTFSICSISRYTGQSQLRILRGGQSSDWLHGHYYGIGVAYYEAFVTASSSTVPGPVTDWLVMCGENTAPYSVRANNIAVGIATGPTSGGKQLTINYQGQYEDNSDWAVAEVAIWNRSLTVAEMSEASALLLDTLSGSAVASIPCIQKCGAGTWGNVTDATSQETACPYACPAGRWGNVMGATSEAAACAYLCGPGRWGSVTGASSEASACPNICLNGFWGNIIGATSQADACSNRGELDCLQSCS